MGVLRPDTKVQFLKGIGARRAEAFARLGIFTAQDLLWHLPHRYIDASQVTPLAKARVGDDVACVGRVVDTGVQPTRRLENALRRAQTYPALRVLWARSC